MQASQPDDAGKMTENKQQAAKKEGPFKAQWRATAARVRSEHEKNSWLDLADHLAERWVAPRYNVSFVMYLISGVLILGGISVWLELITFGLEYNHYWQSKAGTPRPSLDSVLTAIHTFYPALAWSSAMQIALSEKSEKFLKSFALAVGSIILLLAVIMMMISEVVWPLVSVAFGVVGTIVAILLWWIGNAKDETYQDTSPQNVGLAPKGGPVDPEKPMPGDTDGFDFGNAAL